MFRSGRRVVYRDSGSCSWIILLILSGLTLGFVCKTEYDKYEQSKAFDQASREIVHLDHLGYTKESQLVHYFSQNFASEPFGDVEFGIETQSSASLRRNVEYCQWEEHFTEEKDDQDNIVRSYYYTKGWRPFLVNSMFFDQPGAHYNPSYDPFPARTFYPTQLVVDSAKVSIELLKAAKPFKRVEISKQDYDRFSQSVANQQLNVKYAGNGYFYYTASLSTTEKLLRLAGMALEGTLLDFQLGDLFSVCNAGDIRYWFDHVDLKKGVSVVANYSSLKNELSVYSTSRGYELGLMRSGELSANQMMQLELKETRWTSLFSRFLLFLTVMALVSTRIQVQFNRLLLVSLFCTIALLSAIWSVLDRSLLYLIPTLLSVVLLRSISSSCTTKEHDD